eukprot:gene35855-43488_t
MELTAEQLLKIEENRLKALKKLQERQNKAQNDIDIVCNSVSESIVPLSVPVAPAPVRCQHQLSDQGDAVCGSSNIDTYLLENFNEPVCKTCAKANGDMYGMLTARDCAAQFCLPEETVRRLPHARKPNPHHSTWREMHLFLRKHALAAALERHGGVEGLERERQKRAELKMKRDLAKTLGDWDDALQDFRQTLGDADALPSQPRQDEQPRRTDKKSQAHASKRRKLLGLVKLIRGEEA